VGLTLQIAALHLGALGVVQPLMVSGLLFALILRQRSRRQISYREIAWGVVLCVSLAGFLLLAGTARQPISTEPADRIPAVVAAVVGAVLATACVLLGRRQRHGGRSAALLGVAVGAIYASTAALLKALTNIALHGPVALFTSWQLYAVLLLGACGLLLNQLAFQAGPLAASLPAIATVDPLASIALGVVVYDEELRRSVGSGFGLAILLVVLGVAVIQLSRSGIATPTARASASDLKPHLLPVQTSDESLTIGRAPSPIAGRPPLCSSAAQDRRSCRAEGPPSRSREVQRPRPTITLRRGQRPAFFARRGPGCDACVCARPRRPVPR